MHIYFKHYDVFIKTIDKLSYRINAYIVKDMHV